MTSAVEESYPPDTLAHHVRRPHRPRLNLGHARILCIVAMLCGVAEIHAQAGATYDLGAQMSFVRNPNAAWEYGFTTTGSLDVAVFRLCALADAHGPIAFWHPSGIEPGDAGYYPYVAMNRTGTSRLDPTSSWALRPHEVAMEASNSGQYAVVRFTVPVNGTYRVKARFAGIHLRLSSTDVHVLCGDTHLFDAEIDGYGGDPAFHAIIGTAPTARYSGRLALAPGDVLAFAVGYGSNRTHYNDTTALLLRIQRILP